MLLRRAKNDRELDVSPTEDLTMRNLSLLLVFVATVFGSRVSLFAEITKFKVKQSGVRNFGVWRLTVTGSTSPSRGVKKLGRRSNTVRNEVSTAGEQPISAELESRSASTMSAEPLAPELA